MQKDAGALGATLDGSLERELAYTVLAMPYFTVMIENNSNWRCLFASNSSARRASRSNGSIQTGLVREDYLPVPLPDSSTNKCLVAKQIRGNAG
jgi:hypothetical protein